MSASKGLSRLLHSLLDCGITIDDGKERIILTACRSPGRRGAKAGLTFTVKTMSHGRGGGRLGEFPATAFTPTGKVSSRKLHAIIAHFPDGISTSDLARQSGVARAKLVPTVQKLATKGLVVERSGRFFPVGGSSEPGRGSRRRLHDACTVPNCHDPHYAKGLCNNHYNSMRRQSARHAGQSEGQRRSTGSFKDIILDYLRDGRDHSLFELASSLNEKWQTLRKDVQELVLENRIVKDGKKYFIAR